MGEGSGWFAITSRVLGVARRGRSVAVLCWDGVCADCTGGGVLLGKGPAPLYRVQVTVKLGNKVTNVASGSD